MKPRLHIGWVLFAIVMVWSECLRDLPRILFPHRTSPGHLFTAITNVLAATGLTFYAFRLTGSRAFWRVYAPFYAVVIAAEFGLWLPAFTIATQRMLSVSNGSIWAVAGIVTVSVPLLAMTVYSIIALFRLGDWIGPTRRPVGTRPQQLSLPL